MYNGSGEFNILLFFLYPKLNGRCHNHDRECKCGDPGSAVCITTLAFPRRFYSFDDGWRYFRPEADLSSPEVGPNGVVASGGHEPDVGAVARLVHRPERHCVLRRDEPTGTGVGIAGNNY